ncbi:hypothetical protein ACSVC9_11310 [Clostridium sp. LBM24168]
MEYIILDLKGKIYLKGGRLKMQGIRLLKAGEIEVRIQSIKKTNNITGCVLLLYKDARVDMRILDETFGMTGWRRTHELINGNLFCNIDIWDDDKKEWIRKQDVGVESHTEKEKGQASDSFKRAGFNIGIGRELYTAPFIWINLQDGEVFQKGNSLSLSPKIHFKVKSIGYNDNREINSLRIEDNNHRTRYSLDKTTVGEILSKNKYNCEKCGAEITENIANYSKSKFGHTLCINCQKSEFSLKR